MNKIIKLKILIFLIPTILLLLALGITIIVNNSSKPTASFNRLENSDNFILETDNASLFNTDNIFTTDNHEFVLSAQFIPTTTPVATVTTTISKTVAPTTKAVTTTTPKPTVKITTVAPTVTQIITPSITTTIDYSKPWPVAAGCPISTQRCVPCTSGSSCRFELGQTHGFIGWSCQNNNPGNIRPSASRDNMIVTMGGTASCGKRVGTGGEYMVFKDYTTGLIALKSYLKAINAGMHSSYRSETEICGDCSLRFFLGKYSLNYSTYPDSVGAYLGLNPDTTTLRFAVDNRLDDLAIGMQRAEGFFTY